MFQPLTETNVSTFLGKKIKTGKENMEFYNNDSTIINKRE